jgi:hypothetical protein
MAELALAMNWARKKNPKKRKRLNFHEEAYVSPRNNAYVVYS